MTTTTLQASAQSQLRQLIEQIERLEEEKRATGQDITDKYAEAKSIGFDPKIMKKIVSLRKKSKTDRQEEEALLETYMHALGMLDGTPMGDWMSKREAAESDQKPEITDGEKAAAQLLDAEKRGAAYIEYGTGIWPVTMFRQVLTEMGIIKPSLAEQATTVVAGIVDEALGEPTARQRAAAARLSDMAKEDGAKETTISINGGPEVPLSVAMEAMDQMKRRGRRAAKQAAE